MKHEFIPESQSQLLDKSPYDALLRELYRSPGKVLRLSGVTRNTQRTICTRAKKLGYNAKTAFADGVVEVAIEQPRAVVARSGRKYTTREQQNEMVSMRESGATARVIAERFNLSIQTVYAVFHRLKYASD